MWVTGKVDRSSQRELIFKDLFSECRLASSGASLSYATRSKLERFCRQERREIVSHQREGCSPLFISCKKGNAEIAKYLIETCDADVEQRGIYEVPDDRSMHFVTPLWCAAVAGHLNVVKCLVEHGAQVNSVSDTGSTVVRSACFMTRFDIVVYLVQHGADILMPNYNGGTCLINSVQSVDLCKFLLDNGADVNAQDTQLKTALHYAIQEFRFDTTKLFLSYNADHTIRSRYGDDALQLACIKGALQIFDYLLETLEYPPERVAEAHELIGTTAMLDQHDVQTTLLHWKIALNMRQRYNIPKPTAAATHAAYLHRREFTTLAELEAAALDLDELRIQALLMTERILGRLHKDTIYRLMFRGAGYADGLEYQRCIDMWMYVVELRLEKNTLLHTETCIGAQSLARMFVDTFGKFNDQQNIAQQVRYCDVMYTIRLIVDRIPETLEALNVRPNYKRHLEIFDKTLRVLTHLIFVLNALPKTPEQTLEMRRLIYRIVELQPRCSDGDTLLHLVVSRGNVMRATVFMEELPMTIFPSPDVTELLVDCGADVEATNDNQSTPLHIACLRNNYNEAVVNILLSRGAHIDRRNSTGNQPYLMLSGIYQCKIRPLQYITLKCLAARKVASLKIAYDSSTLPRELHHLVEIHDAVI